MSNLICHAPGDRCLGCKAYREKHGVCEYVGTAPTPDLDAAKTLLREMAEFLIRSCGVTSKEEDDRFRELYRRAKEMIND